MSELRKQIEAAIKRKDDIDELRAFMLMQCVEEFEQAEADELAQDRLVDKQSARKIKVAARRDAYKMAKEIGLFSAKKQKTVAEFFPVKNGQKRKA